MRRLNRKRDYLNKDNYKSNYNHSNEDLETFESKLDNIIESQNKSKKDLMSDFAKNRYKELENNI